MKARSAKAKGTRLEKWVTAELSKLGLRCHRQPGSGIYQDWPHDVQVEIHGDRWIVECKSRKEPPKTYEGWLGGADVLVIRADRSEPRVYMRWATFSRLVERVDESGD